MDGHPEGRHHEGEIERSVQEDCRKDRSASPDAFIALQIPSADAYALDSRGKRMYGKQRSCDQDTNFYFAAVGWRQIVRKEYWGDENTRGRLKTVEPLMHQ